jgi:GNAT superfamily N-acetyltransferase
MEDKAAPTLNLNGYTDLPRGKIAAVATYLEIRSAPPPVSASPGYRVERLHDIRRYKDIFARVGQPWLWFSRAAIEDDQLSGILNDPDVEAYLLLDVRGPIGLLELDFRTADEPELLYFGLVSEAIGRGAGRYFMGEALRIAFSRPIPRLTVHTCTLDHPGALAFYMRSGFVPYKQAIEIADDPRLKGVLPLAAAPQTPIFRP